MYHILTKLGIEEVIRTDVPSSEFKVNEKYSVLCLFAYYVISWLEYLYNLVTEIL